MYFCLKFITHEEKSSIFKVFEKSNVTLQTFLCLVTDHPMGASQVWGNYETTCTLPKTEIVAVDIWKHNFSISWDLSVSFQRLVCSLSCIQHRRQHYILYGSLKIVNHFMMYFCLKFITHDEKSSIFKVFEKHHGMKTSRYQLTKYNWSTSDNNCNDRKSSEETLTLTVDVQSFKV